MSSPSSASPPSYNPYDDGVIGSCQCMDHAVLDHRCCSPLWQHRFSWLTTRWIINIILATIIWVLSTVVHGSAPVERMFHLEDWNIGYPVDGKTTVSTPLLVVLSLGIPWILFIILNMLLFKSWHDTFVAGLGITMIARTISD